MINYSAQSVKSKFRNHTFLWGHHTHLCVLYMAGTFVYYVWLGPLCTMYGWDLCVLCMAGLYMCLCVFRRCPKKGERKKEREE